MASQVLLVADDLATIAGVKRALGAQGYEVVLATSAADAVIAWGHHLPPLMLLQPSVEGDRGGVVLEELQAHPDGRLLRVLLLGETLPGFGYPVEPLPIEAEHFIDSVTQAMRGADEEGEAREEAPTPPPPEGPEPGETPQPPAASTPPETGETSALPAPVPTAPSGSLEEALFGDLPDMEASMHADLEAQAIASVESSLAQREQDSELQRLEDEVRAEAQRRRQAREASQKTPLATPAEKPTPAQTAVDEETAFGEQEEITPLPVFSRSSVTLDVLGRADAIRLESRAQAEAAQQGDERDAHAREAAAEASSRRAEHAETLVRREREAREALETELVMLREATATANDTIAQADAEHAALETRVAELTRELATVSEDLLGETARREALEADAAALAEAKVQLAELTARLAQLETQHSTATTEFAQVKVERDTLNERLAVATGTTAELETLRAEFERFRAEAQAREATTAEHLKETQASLEAAKARGEGLAATVVELETSLAGLRSSTHELTNERDVLRGDLERATSQLGTATGRIDTLSGEVTQLRTSLEEASARADTAEAGVTLAAERLRELELRSTMPLSLPGRRQLGVPRMGKVDIEGLSALVGQLVLAQADVRLELAVADGVRTVWFRRGQVLAAESTLAYESLIERARRDGLIDARQEGELRMLRHASAREQLDALKARGLVRDIEAIPLAQRYTEQLALEAFGEPTTQYRLADEVPSAQVLLAAAPRPTLPMVAEALRRALPADALLEKLGGSDSVCTPNETDLDVRTAGFAERERKMLSWVDGETTVEDLALASGLKPDVAFRALLVAKLLGLISVKVPEKPRAPVSTDVDAQRLDSKFDQVQDADYFSILGLPRTAGADDVQRAFDRLSMEFDPLKYSGHPDAAVQQRAQVVYAHLEEAARALADDRRRTEYARHLAE